jgi:cytochrome c556
MTKTPAIRIALAGLALCLSQAASAQFAKPEDAVKYRQSALTVMANHMGRLSAMAKGERPFDAAAAQASARVIDMVGQLPWEAFVAGTSSKGLKTEPWADAADFKARSDRLMGETAKLVQAAGSLDTLRAQVGATGAACKNCHEKYRN